MDENFLERADELATQKIREGVAAAGVREPMPPGFDGKCECGGLIPIPRVTLGYYRCVVCQSEIERRGRFYR